MKRFILTPRARQDVHDIWDYIANDNIEAADRVIDALDNAMIKLAKNPGMGHRRDELTDKRHRFLLVYSYLIVYRHESPSRSSGFCTLHAMCRASLAWHQRSINPAPPLIA